MLICCDLLAQFAQPQYQTSQQYKTSQQRADLLCPVKVEVHSEDSEMLISRFTEQLNNSVMSRAVGIIIEANTPVHGPLRAQGICACTHSDDGARGDNDCAVQ